MGVRFSGTFGGFHIARSPALAAGLFFLTLLVSLACPPFLHFESDVQRTFASDSENARAFSDLLASLETRPRAVVVLVEAERDLQTSDLEVLRDFSLDLALLDNVLEVASPFALRYPPGHPEHPNALAMQLQEGDPPFAGLRAFEEEYPGFATMTAEDRRSLLISVLPADDLGEDEVAELLRQIEETADALPLSGVRLTLTGEDPVALAIVDALIGDLVHLNALGALAAFLVSLLIFRSLTWALVSFIPAVVAAAFSLALFVLLGMPVTVTNVAVPILVLVLALADGMHLSWHMRGLSADMPLREARLETVAAIAPANALTSLTTAIGFASIAVSDFVQLDELAPHGALAVLAAYWIVLSGVLLLAGLARRGQPAKGLQMPGFVARVVTQRPLAVLAVAGLVTAGSGAAALQVEPWFPIYENLPENHEVRRAHRVVERQFGGYLRMWFEIDAKEGEEDLRAATWERVRAVTEAARHAAPEATVISLASLAQWSGSPEAPPGPDLMDELPETLLAELEDPADATSRVVVLVREPMHDAQTRVEHDRLVASALAAGADRVVGFPVILRQDALDLVTQLGFGLAIACVAATATIALAFRSIGLFPILLLPNLLPLLLATGSLTLLSESRINPTAVLALTVAFGIAVDDSIHFVNRYSLERQKGVRIVPAIVTTIGETGRVMIATTLLISAGVSATFISDFSTVRLFGAMLITIFLSALMADLLVLPAMIRRGWWR